MKALQFKRSKPSEPVPAAVPLPDAFRQALRLALGTTETEATVHEKFEAMALAIRERLVAQWKHTEQQYRQANAKRVHFISPEYLIGRTLQNAVINLNLDAETQAMMHNLGVTLEEIYESEHDASFGNGGLARLAACFLDSLATQGFPASGHGLRYDYGLFNQQIVDGQQVDQSALGLMYGNPWEICCRDQPFRVRFGGVTRHATDSSGRYCVKWTDSEDVLAMPCRVLVPGYRNGIVNPLLLWRAIPTAELPQGAAADTDYILAMSRKHAGELVSRVLHPSQKVEIGRELRLKQEYFLAAAVLQSIVRDYLLHNSDMVRLPEKVAIHINDTHHAVAIPELMRLLVDDYAFPWEAAWNITTRTFAFTSHTLLPEALERWEVGLFGRILPRHLEIIYEINRRFLDRVATRFGGDHNRMRAMSLIEEDGGKKIRMGNLAAVGSHSISGVSQFHARLLATRLLRNFHDLWPEKFNARTNGITSRRWLFQANPALAQLITEAIGDGWIRDLGELNKLDQLADDGGFTETWQDVKRQNKVALSDYAARQWRMELPTDMMFDVHATRIHPLKRHLLNILHIVGRYQRLLENPEDVTGVPRAAIFAGKAAPSDPIGKLLIRLIHDVAVVVNNDKRTRQYLRVLFLPNYRVSLAERIFPAIDLAEHLAYAGLEPCGTGMMKSALNGALIIGSQGGANLEIRDAVGADRIFLFGLTEEQSCTRKAQGYDSRPVIQRTPVLRKALELLGNGFFAGGDIERYRALINHLTDAGDPFMIAADFASYAEAQERVEKAFLDRGAWVRTAIRNIACMGRFSSDRTIREYAEQVWHIRPVGSG